MLKVNLGGKHRNRGKYLYKYIKYVNDYQCTDLPGLSKGAKSKNARRANKNEKPVAQQAEEEENGDLRSDALKRKC